MNKFEKSTRMDRPCLWNTTTYKKSYIYWT